MKWLLVAYLSYVIGHNSARFRAGYMSTRRDLHHGPRIINYSFFAFPLYDIVVSFNITTSCCSFILRHMPIGLYPYIRLRDMDTVSC